MLDAAVVEAPAQAAEPGVWRAHDPDILGTRMNIVVVAGQEAAALMAAQAARDEVKRLNTLLNARDPASELSRLNSGGGGQVSADLFAVLALSEQWRRDTGGAYDARLGAVADLWRAGDSPPEPAAISAALAVSRQLVTLKAGDRAVAKPAGLTFALDGLAKGYIVDQALAAGRAASPAIQGLLVDIGGDMACWGRGPQAGRWLVVVDACDAPADITGTAIATSGRGPRDRNVEGARISQTLSPATGRPVRRDQTATVIAPCAATADALATAALVVGPVKSKALFENTPDARLWRADQTLLKQVSSVPKELRWPPDWGIEMVYQAPNRQTNRSADFRSPYMVLWVSDANNRPIRTVTMVGKEPKYHRDNFIWWSEYRDDPNRMIDLRSQATALSGAYSLFWRGLDDAWDSVPMGDYILHIETSQEQGKHTHRTVPLKIGSKPFTLNVPATKEGGGLEITYGLKR